MEQYKANSLTLIGAVAMGTGVRERLLPAATLLYRARQQDTHVLQRIAHERSWSECSENLVGAGL